MQREEEDANRLLADPAQTTELERLKAFERDSLRQIHASWELADRYKAWREDAEDERDRLSLMLRAMARKLVGYRKWTLGDDVPEVHRLRREVARLTDLCREMEARAIRISRCSCDNDGIECTHEAARGTAEAERDERQARIANALKVLDEPAPHLLRTDPHFERMNARDARAQLVERVRAALAGDQPTTEEPTRVPCGNPDRNCGRLGGSARCGSCTDDEPGIGS